MAKRAAKKAGKPHPGIIDAAFAPLKKKAAGKKSAVKKSRTFAAAARNKSAK